MKRIKYNKERVLLLPKILSLSSSKNIAKSLKFPSIYLFFKPLFWNYRENSGSPCIKAEQKNTQMLAAGVTHLKEWEKRNCLKAYGNSSQG